MSVYTVYEPPRAAGAMAEPQRFVFVRDGFSLAAFLLAPLWMIWHRQWLVLVLYLLLMFAVDGTLRALGASVVLVGFAGALVSLLVGLEAATLRRFTLQRRRWRNIGMVSGDRLEDAELRFFASWVRQADGRDDTRHASKQDRSQQGSMAAPSAASAEAADVVGLFPEPGEPR